MSLTNNFKTLRYKALGLFYRKYSTQIIATLSMFYWCTNLGAQTQGLENVIVERYYVANADDANPANSDYPVEEGSVTYRVYVDMLPGYKFLAVYGNSNHVLKIEGENDFFNNADRGSLIPGYTITNAKDNTVMLDSWLTTGAGCSGYFAVPKTEDNGVSNVINRDNILQNASFTNLDGSAAIPLTTQDGLYAGSLIAPSFTGLDDQIGVFNDGSTNGKLFSSNGGSWYNPNGVSGPFTSNILCIGQFTVKGTFKFELNIQISKSVGQSEYYVAKNPVGSEIQLSSLSYPKQIPPTVSFTSPAANTSYSEGDVINFVANASDTDDGIASVVFYKGNDSIGFDNTAPYQLSYTINRNNTLNDFTVKAIDNRGAYTKSSALSLNINYIPYVSKSSSLTGVGNESQTVAFSAYTSDPNGTNTISKVEFFIDNVKIGDDNSTPYNLNWTAQTGVHKWFCKAIDNGGLSYNSDTSEISINALPDISLTSPINSLIIEGSAVTITATVSDFDITSLGSIASVMFYADNTLIGTDISSPYELLWTAVKGVDYLKVVATDNRGAKDSSVFDILVTGSPEVSIQSPSSNAVLLNGSKLSINAEATDDGTIAKVSFYAGNTHLGDDTNEPYSIDWNAVTGITYIKVIAYDTDDATDTAIVNITVNTAPIVSITSPVNGFNYKIGSILPIKATATDADGAGSITKVAFYKKYTLLNEDMSAPFEFNWTAEANIDSLRAIVFDEHGATDTAWVSINARPVINMVLPSKDTVITLGEAIKIKTLATDVGGNIDTVVFYADSDIINRSLSAPFECNWTATSGKSMLKAIAYDNKGATDTTTIKIKVNAPPVVTITKPTNNQQFVNGNNIIIQANASDDSGISLVEFFVNNTKVSDDVTNPYEGSWIAQTGTAEIIAKATDNDGKIVTSSVVNIKVNDPSNPLPWVTITSPDTLDVITRNSPVTIQATAFDTLPGNVSKVVFYWNNDSIGQDTDDPYSISYIPLEAGNVNISAIVHDNEKAKSNSNKVAVVVNSLPEVSLQKPIGGTTYNTGDSILLSAFVTEPDATGSITSVAFYANNNLIATDTQSPYEVKWKSITGNIALKAIATDNLSGKDTSDVVTVNVINNEPPVVSIDFNQKFIYTGDTLTFTAQATDNAPGMVAKVEFYINDIKKLEDAISPYFFNWISESSAPNDSSKLIAIVYDNNGASHSDTVTFKVAPNTPPTVVLTSPNNSAEYQANELIFITASASDNEGFIKKVEIYRNDTLVETKTAEPYATAWNSIPGTHAFKAKAYDNRNTSTESASVSIFVNPVPNISITSPVRMSKHVEGDSVSITATATDNGSIKKVDFFANNQLFATDSITPYSVKWKAELGQTLIKATATDNKNAINSDTLSIKVIENNKPTINFVDPVSEALEGDEINIIVNSYDSEGIASLALYVNNVKISEVNKSNNTFSWNTTGYSGEVTIKALAIDMLGIVGDKIITINVMTKNFPTIVLTKPLNNTIALLGDSIEMYAEASDTDGSIEKVFFFVNDSLVISDQSTPYSFKWKATQGSKRIYAVAYDNHNLNDTSEISIVNVYFNSEPTISITSPIANSWINENELVKITASAFDSIPGTIEKVTFYVGNTKLGDDTIAPFEYDWTPTSGKKQLKAVATDNTGLTTTSAIIAVNVNAAPIVSISQPKTSSQLTAGQIVNFSVTAVDDASISKVEFYVNNAIVGVDSIAPYSIEWIPNTASAELFAIAYDNRNFSAKSSVVTISNIITDVFVYKVSSEKLLLYPVPVQEILNIVLPKQLNETYSISIVEAQSGKTVMNFPMGINSIKNNATLNVGELTPGYYLLRIKSRSGIWNGQFIKK